MRLLFLLLLASCGIEPSECRVVESQAPGGNGDQLEQRFIVEIKPLTDRFCLACHSNAPFLQSGSAFKASSSQSRIQSGNMPQVGSSQASSFDAQSRAKLLNF